jgi:hypothetical protein
MVKFGFDDARKLYVEDFRILKNIAVKVGNK